MAINPMTNQSADTFSRKSTFLAPRGDKLIRFNISRNGLIAILFSLLVHAMILLLVLPQIQLDTSTTPMPTAMEVSLAPPVPPQEIAPLPEQLPELPPELLIKNPAPEKPAPKVIKIPPKVMTKKLNNKVKPAFTVPEVLATPSPAPETVPPKIPEVSVMKETTQEAPTDMASYVKQQQAKRNAGEADAAQQNAEAVARELGPSAEQVRDERIKNNFKSGTNGIFEITSLSGRHAAFTFKGWTNDYSNARRESFEVEAETGQDVRLVMIKKMIALIRQHYQGDFNWESQRLGRTVIQSARIEDDAGLEDFMMMEFFGTHYKTKF
ncbi:MAG: hypothetical protein WBC07_06485 [Methylotenera sp.]